VTPLDFRLDRWLRKAIVRCCFRDLAFSRFSTVSVCDGRTDGRTDRRLQHIPRCRSITQEKLTFKYTATDRKPQEIIKDDITQHHIDSQAM